MPSSLEFIRAKVEEVRRRHQAVGNYEPGDSGACEYCHTAFPCDALTGWEAAGAMAEKLDLISSNVPGILYIDEFLADIAEGLKNG
jgi:hypothetical protein